MPIQLSCGGTIYLINVNNQDNLQNRLGLRLQYSTLFRLQYTSWLWSIIHLYVTLFNIGRCKIDQSETHPSRCMKLMSCKSEVYIMFRSFNHLFYHRTWNLFSLLSSILKRDTQSSVPNIRVLCTVCLGWRYQEINDLFGMTEMFLVVVFLFKLK